MNGLAKVLSVAMTAVTVAVIIVGCSKPDDPQPGGNDNPAFVPEYVDLDLPSGTLWATCNVGAETPEGIGDYFAWGETEPKDVYDWSGYKYGDIVDGLFAMTKYCSDSCCGFDGF